MSLFNRRAQQRINRLDHKLEFALAQIRKVQALRLWTGTLACLGLVFSAVWPHLQLAVPILVLFLAIFPVLVSISRKWNRHFESLKTWRDFEVRQESRRQGVWIAPNDSDELWNLDKNGVANDLDLFGRKSLFSQLDETFSKGAQTKLAQLLVDDSSLEKALRCQKLLKDLRLYRWYFLRFRLSNPSESEGQFASRELLSSLDNFPKPSHRLNALMLFVMASWIVAVALLIYYPGIWGLFIAAHALFLLSQGKLLSEGEGVLQYFSSLARSFEWLESARMPLAMRQMCKVIRSEKVSAKIRRLSWPLVALSVESHPLVYLIVNFFFPWNSLFGFVLIRQVHSIGEKMSECFSELEEVEVLTSLVVLTTDQTECFAELVGGTTANQQAVKITFKAEKLFHPLIESSRRVPNDFQFGIGEKMILLTGSNMSGKSTFLRTVGVNQVLANIGAPVFAASMQTLPYRVRSCIRVSDSLEQGTSYFYAEVQRLKKLLDEAQMLVNSGAEAAQTKISTSTLSLFSPFSPNNFPVLYLIDEIFRGTNNRERLIGSRSIINSLLKTPALGFISTHDLELTSIAETTSGQVHNYHFRDEARDGRMYFPFQIFDGPSPTTNALKIMRSAGLPVSES